jgi:nucleotide-binding universal stress UspA family protein
MTILVGFSSSRHGAAPLNLGAQLAQTSGEPMVAAAVVERPWPPRDDVVERQYLRHLTRHTEESLREVVGALPGADRIPIVVHQAVSIPAGLAELVEEHRAHMVVVGSSSSGLLGRVALGSVTDRLVHTASVPVAIAPRGHPLPPGRINRITAAYGGDADVNGLLGAASELASRWGVPLRITSLSVRPMAAFAGRVDATPEDLVVQRWQQRAHDEITVSLGVLPEGAVRPEIVLGTGRDWRDAVESVPWRPGDILALGSGAAGEAARVFLGSVAAKILRHSPVPVLILPRP